MYVNIFCELCVLTLKVLTFFYLPWNSQVFFFNLTHIEDFTGSHRRAGLLQVGLEMSRLKTRLLCQ